MSENMPATQPDWLDELTEEVCEKIGEVSKFKTHKIRKNFMGEITSLIKDAVNKNTIAKPAENPVRITKAEITRPNPKATQGFAVMNEGLSAKGDDITGAGPGSAQPGPPPKQDQMLENARKHNAGVRRW